MHKLIYLILRLLAQTKALWAWANVWFILLSCNFIVV